MELIEAFKSRDLTLIEKLCGKIMEAKKAALIEAERVAIASSVMIEGEEPVEDDEDEDDEETEDEE